MNGIIEQLIQLTKVTAVGNCISKAAKDRLISHGLATSFGGFVWLTELGVRTLHTLGLISDGQYLTDAEIQSAEQHRKALQAAQSAAHEMAENESDNLWLLELSKRAVRAGFSWEDKDGETREDGIEYNVDAFWDMAYKAGFLDGKIKGLETAERNAKEQESTAKGAEDARG